MRYDIYLFHGLHLRDPNEIAQLLTEGDYDSLTTEEPRETQEQRKHHVAEALLQADPDLTRFIPDFAKIAQGRGCSEDEARRDFTHIELNGPDDGNRVQIMLFDESITITVGFGNDNMSDFEVWTDFWKYLDVCLPLGYTAIDGQDNRILNPETDRDPERYAAQQSATPIVSVSPSPPSPPTRLDAPRKPWWRFW